MFGDRIRPILSRGVGRRIFVLFLVAALIPMCFTAWLTSYEFRRGVEDESERALRSSAKAYGVEILSRLQSASDKAREIIRIARASGLSAVEDHEYLVDDFDDYWVVRDAHAPATILEVEGEHVRLGLRDEAFLNGGGTKLVRLRQNELILLQAVGDWAPGCIVAFQLSADRIWAPPENRPINTEFCVFGPDGERLYCTAPIDGGVHAVLTDATQDRVGVSGEWHHAGEAQIAAMWQLFLDGAFAAPALDVVALLPKSFALRSGADFGRVFLPAVALVLVLVALLSLNLIARNLVPLQQLTAAARQFASGDLARRVRVATGDEFEALADAFNNMASTLGHQISTLEAMSGIDRLILSGTKLENVSEDVVGHLVSLTECESAAVIARDADAPNQGMMTSRHDGTVFRDRVRLPRDVGNRWCQPRQVCLEDVDSRDAPYKSRFLSFGQAFVVVVPVILKEDFKGVLLLGFNSRNDMSANRLDRMADLAGRFAVALSSAEREETLYRQAHFDALTGLPNRQLLKDRLEQQVASARLDEYSGAVLFLDLDRFKEINDVFGHSVGDAVLIQASQRIVVEVRERDTVARLGGDEFVVVLPKIRNENIARATAERLLDRLSEAFTVKDVDHYLSASIGIVMFPEDGESVESLLKNADAAMYRAKDMGRNRFEFFSRRLNAQSRRKIGLERDLRRAFQHGILELYYQPQFDTRSGEISGAEALLRWPHPEEGFISPAEFIPLAEESGLIVDLGAWVIERACADLREILDRGLHPGSVSINVSARQLREADFRRAVMDPIHRHHIHPGYLQLEVTETAVAQNRDTAIALLNALRSEGVRVAIDDFGTGYSSLSYLQQLPFDAIKIDKSFVDKIGSGETSDNICRTVIRMSEELGKKSIGEGVETLEQLEFLRANRCDIVQGFYYSHPLPQSQFIEFVETQDAHTQRRKALEIL